MITVQRRYGMAYFSIGFANEINLKYVFMQNTKITNVRNFATLGVF